MSSRKDPSDLHVVLVEPDIPWNTGNVGRTCLAVGAQLHLVRPLGFRLDERYLKRAGLDYWQHVQPDVWPSWSAFEDKLSEIGTPWLFSAEGKIDLWNLELSRNGGQDDDTDFSGADSAGSHVLIFGRESAGLSRAVREAYRSRLVRLSMADGPVRSLNLSTTVGIVLYEFRRRLGFPAAPQAGSFERI